MYLWELVGHDTAEGVIVSGIDSDLAAVMRTGEALLRQRGLVVRVAEVVSRLSVLHLDSIYVPTGRVWLGRRTKSGGVHWSQSDRALDPAAAYTLVASQDASRRAS